MFQMSMEQYKAVVSLCTRDNTVLWHAINIINISLGKDLSHNGWRSVSVVLYSETTWAVGIAQLTHQKVQGGGKNPETEGRGIFATTADRVVS